MMQRDMMLDDEALPVEPPPAPMMGEQMDTAAQVGSTVAAAQDAVPVPAPVVASAEQDVTTVPFDEIGDIPPPPVPAPPSVAGLPGAGTFARPGTPGAAPFHTPAYRAPQRGPRFGPGVPMAGGMGMSPEDAAEMLRRLAAGGRM